MASYNNPSNNPKPPTQAPMLLMMLHPTSGRENFNQVNYQTGFPSQLPMDPRFSAAIQMQTQRALAASNIPTGFPYQGAIMPGYSPYANVSTALPYQGATIPGYSPYGYGIYQPYAFSQRR